MMKTTRSHIFRSLLACLALAVLPAPATEIIANFTTNSPVLRPAAYDPGLANLNSGWAQNTTNAGISYTFRYNISGLGIETADELLITVATADNTATLNAASGNGIAVNGGLDDTHWDPSDPGLNFTVVVEDASNTNITSNFTIDLTGVAMRWGAGATATFAGQAITRSATNEGVTLDSGQTAETFFTATRTGTTSLTQVQQLRFNISSVPPPTGPNVIVYLLDDLGLTDVQQHPTYFPDGSPLFETPNMHRLASQGMRFNNAYAQPLCSASRCCLLSGQDTAAREGLYMAIVASSVPDPVLPATSGPTLAYNYPTDRDHMPLAVETIAERLKAAGYVTWHAGKWHLSPTVANTAYYPDKQGFDKQLGVGGSGPPSYFGPFSTIPNMVDYNGNSAPGATGVHIGKHMQTLVQDMINNHLATDPARPFFLYYPAYSVHSPHQAKKSLFNYFQTKLAGLPNSKHRHPVMAAQIASADQELGSMMDYLDTKGLSNNTLFIFLSDNGGLSITYQSGTIVDDIGTDEIPDNDPANVVNGTYAKTSAPVDPSTRMTNMDPRRAGKGSLFDGGLRVPMIIRYPNGGISAATASNEPVSLTDIYQTILDYTPAVAKPGYPLDGVSLKPVLQQTGSLPDRDIFVHFPRNNETWGTAFLRSTAPQDYDDPENYPFEYYPGGTAMIHYPYKMIARYSTAHGAAAVNYQLYRMDLDAGEATNVAGRYPEVVDAMRKRLEAYYSNTSALVPTRNPNYDGTSVNSPETTAKAFLAAAGLNPNTPETFLLADPDLDERRNEDEFLEQTNPNAADSSVATTWLCNNGTFDELRFAIPANVSQASFQILNANGTVAFTPSSGLALDAQYGPFYVYKPTNPQPGGVPGNYRISLITPTPGPSLTPDADGDGLPDAYENSNGLNSNNPADGNTDNDGDGLTRGQEYLAGTSDFDSNDFQRLQCVGQPGAGGSLRFDLKDQKAYRLHKSANLANWTLSEDFGVISGNHAAILPLSNEGDRQFYKLEAYQAP